MCFMKISFEFEFEFSEVENVNLTSVLGCKSFYNFERHTTYTILHGWKGSCELIYIDSFCAGSHTLSVCEIDVLHIPFLATLGSSEIVELVVSKLK